MSAEPTIRNPATSWTELRLLPGRLNLSISVEKVFAGRGVTVTSNPSKVPFVMSPSSSANTLSTSAAAARNSSRYWASSSRSSGVGASDFASLFPSASTAERVSGMVVRSGAKNFGGRGEDTVDLRRADHERRQVAHDRWSSAEREDALVLQCLQGRAGVLLELDAREQAKPADLAHLVAAQRAQAVQQLCPALPRARREVETPHLADRRDRRRARERVPAERRRVRALRQIPNSPRERDRAHRQAARDRFRDAEDVRDDVVLLEREHGPGPAEAGLDLVDDQQRASLPAEARGLLDELPCRWPDTALALHELDDERGGLAGDGRVERLGLVERNVREARHERPEDVAVLRPPGRRQRAHRLAVEAAHRRDHAVPLRRGARELQRAFDRLGAAVAEE